MRKNKGFTLIEVMMVVSLLGILAAVADPVMRHHVKKAIITEAIVALGTIRTVERVYFSEHGEYCSTGYQGIDELPGVEEGDLNGTYFSELAYYVDTEDNNTKFKAYCDICDDNLIESKADYVLRVLGVENAQIYMDQDGDIIDNIPHSGYPELG